MVVLRVSTASYKAQFHHVPDYSSASSQWCEVPECNRSAQLLSCRFWLLVSLSDMLSEGFFFFILILYLISYQCYTVHSIKIPLQIYVFQSYGPWFHYRIFGISLRYRKKLWLDVFHSVWVFWGKANVMKLNIII